MVFTHDNIKQLYVPIKFQQQPKCKREMRRNLPISSHFLLFAPGISLENMLKLHCGLSISEELLKTEHKQTQSDSKSPAQFVSHAEILTH